jgi:MFS family permease
VSLLWGLLSKQQPSRKFKTWSAKSTAVLLTNDRGGHNSILGGRFVTGMGVGSLSMIVPMYNAEVAPPEVRGSLVSLQQLAIVFGIMISFWID